MADGKHGMMRIFGIRSRERPACDSDLPSATCSGSRPWWRWL